MSLSLQFLGAVGTVTGSRYLLEHDGKRLLIDCGLFQGVKQLRLRNWAPFPVPPASIDAVILTHAHIDHSGYLPALVRDGFKGRVYCSDATLDYCEIMLNDSAHLQEVDADMENRHRISKHNPSLPLYTVEDAERALKQFAPITFDTAEELPCGARITLRRSGHILGAASIELDWGGKRVVFSGDLGRYDDPIMLDPTSIKHADFLLIESTYGDRLHDRIDPEVALEAIVSRTVSRGGTVIIPAFAVGRAQSLLFHLQRLKDKGKLANVPVYLNSPMAVDASHILCRHPADIRLSAQQCTLATGVARYVRSVEESIALNKDPTPKVIISASGMATGGRVLHHLVRYAPDPKNTILFSGFQTAGTRGAAMMAGAKDVKIHGQYISVRAEIQNLPMLSAHADADEIMRWLQGFEMPPRMTYITHGEPVAADALRHRIEEERGWKCTVPEQLQREDLH